MQRFDTPAEMADHFRSVLSSLLHGGHFEVSAERGVRVEYAHWEPDEYIRLQLKSGYGSLPPNVRAVVLVVPAGPGTPWSAGDLEVKFGGSKDDLEGLKAVGATFRRTSHVPPEKAAKLVVDWFKKNAPKLTARGVKAYDYDRRATP